MQTLISQRSGILALQGGEDVKGVAAVSTSVLPSLGIDATDRVVVVGIGSEERGDDGAGVAVVRRLEACEGDGFHTVRAGVAPENYTGTIKQSDPDVVVLVDAVAFGGDAGDVKRIDPENLRAGAISTHNAPLSLFVDYLVGETGAGVVLVGIQPGDVTAGQTLSDPVAAGVERVVAWLRGEV